MSQVRLVRIKRYDPTQGYVRKKFRIRVAKSFLIFDAFNPEWVRVDKSVADILSKERQQPNSLMSPPLFEVQTEDGALAVEAAEKAAREAQKRRLEPTVATAKDLSSVSVEGRGDLSIDEVTASRNAALEASKKSAAGQITPDSLEGAKAKVDKEIPTISKPRPTTKSTKAKSPAKKKAKKTS